LFSAVVFMMGVKIQDATTNLCTWLTWAFETCPSWVSEPRISRLIPWVLYLIAVVVALLAIGAIYRLRRFISKHRRHRGLAKFLVSGTRLLQERITTQAQMDDWWRHTNDWHVKAQAFIRDNYGVVEEALFFSENTASESGVGQSYSAAPVPHRNSKLYLSAKLEAIRRKLNQRN
jgi:hypothetical protein